MKKSYKYLSIIIILVSIVSTTKAQFNLENGDLFDWRSTYNYTTILDEHYSLNVWGYEGNYEGMLTITDEYLDCKINCAIEFLEIDGEIFWETMYVKYISVEEGIFLYEDVLENAIIEGGSFPTLLVLSVSGNDLYTETLDLIISGVAPETPQTDIFIKEKSDE